MQTQATNPGMSHPTPQPENADKNPKLDSYDAADNAYNFRYKKSRRSYEIVRKIAQSATLSLRLPAMGDTLHPRSNPLQPAGGS